MQRKEKDFFSELALHFQNKVLHHLDQVLQVSLLYLKNKTKQTSPPQKKPKPQKTLSF